MIFRESGVSSSFALQPSGKCLLLRVRTVRFHVEYPESLFDAAFHIGIESALQTMLRHGSIGIRDVVRAVEEPFKGIRRELLAEPRAVTDLPVLVVDEGRAIDASIVVLAKYHVYSFSSEQTDELLPVATATVHGKGHIVPYLRLPFPGFVLAGVVTDTFSKPS